MTLLISRGYNGVSDPDAAAYVAAVEAADGQLLENAVGKAINAFVIGCKNDRIWTAIKASCILAGARTLNGALVPLVGTAPTSFNFVAGDYNRKTGLAGNSSSKYLDSNRSNNADPQNNNHNAVFASNLGTTGVLAGANDGSGAGPGANFLGRTGFTRNRCNTSTAPPATPIPGLIATSRFNSSSYVARVASTNGTVNIESGTPENASFLFFRRSAVGFESYTDARLAFYSIGESLNLALLDTRVTTLINAIAAAIP